MRTKNLKMILKIFYFLYHYSNLTKIIIYYIKDCYIKYNLIILIKIPSIKL